MRGEKLKYRDFLIQIPNCPPNHYKEIRKLIFRWVHESAADENDFTPLNIIKVPPQRVLDNTDLTCRGYGLSVYEEFGNSIKAYRKHYDGRHRIEQKQEYIKQKGSYVAKLDVDNNDGIASVPEEWNFGHFTFHEYSGVDLKSKVIELFNIFDSDGEFAKL